MTLFFKVPTPVNAISTAGVAGSLEFILKIPDRVPLDFGLNVTLRFELLPGFIIAVPLRLLNISLSVPSISIDVILRFPVPLLVIFNVFVFSLPILTFPKSCGPSGATEITGAAASKFAVTLFSALIVTWHMPLPEHPPVQPVKMWSFSAFAVTVILWFLL